MLLHHPTHHPFPIHIVCVVRLLEQRLPVFTYATSLSHCHIQLSRSINRIDVIGQAPRLEVATGGFTLEADLTVGTKMVLVMDYYFAN